jgi:hypothetical protein
MRFLCQTAIMRTTVDLTDPLFRKMKATAAFQGISLKLFITLAIESELSKSRVSGDYRVKLPLIRSKRPGTLDLTNTGIEDLLT